MALLIGWTEQQVSALLKAVTDHISSDCPCMCDACVAFRKQIDSLSKQQQPAPVEKSKNTLAVLKLAKYSFRDANAALNRTMLFVDCSECTCGGNGTDKDKCSCGHKVKRGRKGGCFLGTLLPDLYVPPSQTKPRK